MGIIAKDTIIWEGAQGVYMEYITYALNCPDSRWASYRWGSWSDSEVHRYQWGSGGKSQIWR